MNAIPDPVEFKPELEALTKAHTALQAQTMLRSRQVDREGCRVSPLMTDGTVGPMMELHGLVEYFFTRLVSVNEIENRLSAMADLVTWLD